MLRRTTDLVFGDLGLDFPRCFFVFHANSPPTDDLQALVWISVDQRASNHLRVSESIRPFLLHPDQSASQYSKLFSAHLLNPHSPYFSMEVLRLSCWDLVKLFLHYWLTLLVHLKHLESDRQNFRVCFEERTTLKTLEPHLLFTTGPYFHRLPMQLGFSFGFSSREYHRHFQQRGDC